MRRASHAPHALRPTRRVLVTGLSAVVALSTLTACNDDGRTLRPAKPDQTASVSTSSTSIAPSVDQIDDGFPDSVPSSTSPVITDGLTPDVEVQTAWTAGGAVPVDHTCDGENASPPVSWTDVPEGTVEIAISLVDDTDPTGVLWLVAGISADTLGVEAGMIPLGAVEATNSTGDIGYAGPCPAAGTTGSYTLSVHFLAAPSAVADGDVGATARADLTQSEFLRSSLKGSFSRP